MVLKRLLEWLLGDLTKPKRIGKLWKVPSLALTLATIDQLHALPISMDSIYYVPELKEWKNIIESDDLNKRKKYVKDRFDCDNFAIVFAAHCMERYDLNCVGIAVGDVIYDDEEKTRAPHAFNVLPTIKGDRVVLYVYEPQTDELKRGEVKTRLTSGWYIADTVLYG